MVCDGKLLELACNVYLIALNRYETVLTHVYGQQNGADGVWAPIRNGEFLFFDGTANEPMPRRETSNAHFISKQVFVVGITLTVVALVLSVGTAVWVLLCRHHRLIKASQPEFLLILCLGATLVAASAIFASFDEAKGVSTTRLTHLCRALPWFFVLGYLTMYGALFSKLWRISQVLQMRRRQSIGINKVLLPFLVLTTCCFFTLLAWQLTDPLEWHRKVISEGEEPYETYGECASAKFGFLPFVVPLGFFLFVAMGLTVAIAWKTRDVQAELSEARWIFAGIYVHVQTWLVGIPLLYITSGVSKDAFYLMVVVLAFTFSSSQVCLVIWRKMFTLLSERFGLVSHAPNPKISIRGGGTSFVSGLTQSSSRKGMVGHDVLIDEAKCVPNI